MTNLVQDTPSYMIGDGVLEQTSTPQSKSFSFSLQILTHEGFSIKGDVTTMTTVPARKSRPASQIQQPVQVQEDDTIVQADDEEEYDDTPLTATPKSVLRHRPTQQSTKAAPNTGPIQASVGQKTVVKTVVSHRVSGSTRFWLYVILFLGCLFLFNGIVWPALVSVYNQVKYGDAQIATFDLDQHHFITQDTKGTIKIIVMSQDNQHNQILTQKVHGLGDRALVTLSENGAKIDVSANGQYTVSLVSDGKGGYKWEDN